MFTNPLDQYPRIRKALYLVQWIANGITGVLGIVFLNDSHDGVPQSFTVTSLALAFVWTYTGLTASGNVQEPVDLIPAGENELVPPNEGPVE